MAKIFQNVLDKSKIWPHLALLEDFFIIAILKFDFDFFQLFKYRFFHDFDSEKLCQNRRFLDFDQNRPSSIFQHSLNFNMRFCIKSSRKLKKCKS